MVAALGSLLYSEPDQAPSGHSLRNCALKATWRSGYATVCKTVYPGSIPGVASNNLISHPSPLVSSMTSGGASIMTGGLGALGRQSHALPLPTA
jgi:hypothetical protein